MLGAMLALLAFQLAGEAAARWLGLPIPGPVIGLALLFSALSLGGRVARGTGVDSDGVPLPLAAVAGFLLAHLSLLFVPAGVGIVRHAPLIQAHATAILVALAASTLAALAVTAGVFVAVKRHMSGSDAA
jgi:putative effector of murein hydrolase LrgA (UPF0299 family)